MGISAIIGGIADAGAGAAGSIGAGLGDLAGGLGAGALGGRGRGIKRAAEAALSLDGGEISISAPIRGGDDEERRGAPR
jgi:hypothetical protein